MARAGAKARKTPAPAGDPWAAVVAEMRARAAEDRWRLTATARLPYWAEFTVGWAAVAPAVLRDAAVRRVCPAALTDPGRREDWAWQQVEAYLSPTLHLVHDRTAVPDLAVLEVFRVLRGAGLVYPDGSAHAMLLGRLSRRAARAEVLADAEMLDAMVARARARAKLNALSGGSPP